MEENEDHAFNEINHRFNIINNSYNSLNIINNSSMNNNTISYNILTTNINNDSLINDSIFESINPNIIPNERENSIEELFVNLFVMANNNKSAGPIKNDLLNVLPESKIADINKLNEENKKCLICLEEYVNNDNVIYLPCFHIFHKNCIIQWIKKHANCPLCKININEIIK